jgi:hypothetical protein
MRSLSGVTETWWDAGGDLPLARTPMHPDVKTGRGTPRSLYTQLPLGVFLSCFFRVKLDLTFTLYLDGDARCGSKPARWRCVGSSPRG